MRQTAELENQMTSVERIIEYSKLPSEPALDSDEKNAPPIDWPSQGNIEFKALSLSYVENGNRVLSNLTFRIDAKVSMPFFISKYRYLPQVSIILQKKFKIYLK